MRLISEIVVQAGEKRNRRYLLCHADKEDRKNGVNWDDAWSNFKRGAGLDSVDSFTDSNSEKPAAPRNLSTSQKNIRKQESLLVNIFSNQLFFLIAGGVVFALLLGILSVAGT